MDVINQISKYYSKNKKCKLLANVKNNNLIVTNNWIGSKKIWEPIWTHLSKIRIRKQEKTKTSPGAPAPCRAGGAAWKTRMSAFRSRETRIKPWSSAFSTGTEAEK